LARGSEGGTRWPLEAPQYTGDRIPDYKAITISNVIDTTPGDVLIAGLNDEHRTG
jgi:polygalacturonase